MNEFKPLPLAIANLTDKTAEYRVVLETAEGYNGGYGLKGFPEKQITLRKAVRFKDSDQDAGSLRLDPLPKMGLGMYRHDSSERGGACVVRLQYGGCQTGDVSRAHPHHSVKRTGKMGIGQRRFP